MEYMGQWTNVTSKLPAAAFPIINAVAGHPPPAGTLQPVSGWAAGDRAQTSSPGYVCRSRCCHTPALWQVMTGCPTSSDAETAFMS
jgi:hypothetical protein